VPEDEDEAPGPADPAALGAPPAVDAPEAPPADGADTGEDGAEGVETCGAVTGGGLTDGVLTEGTDADGVVTEGSPPVEGTVTEGTPSAWLRAGCSPSAASLSRIARTVAATDRDVRPRRLPGRDRRRNPQLLPMVLHIYPSLRNSNPA
jgi:hypothetical protein